MCTDHFEGPSGASWQSPSDWSNGLPGPSTVVCWDVAKTVVVDEGGQSAASVASGGGLVLRAGGTLALTAVPPAVSSLAAGVEVEDGGELDLRAALACSGVALAGGEVIDDGTLECPLTLARGKLTGTGAVTGPVVNEAGTVEPGDLAAPGGLTFGSYTQFSTGTLAVRQEISGAGVGDHLLRAGGPVSLGGTVSLSPASPPSGFLVLASATEPQGLFAHVVAPEAGSPWTVGYGPGGAVAVMDGSAPVAASISGALLPGSTATCGQAPVAGSPQPWAPRGTAEYSWSGPLRAPGVVLRVPPGVFPGQTFRPEYGVLGEQLDAELDEDLKATLAVPGTAAGRRISCSIAVWTPASTGISRLASGESPEVQIGGPQPTRAPAISGRPAPGSRLTCSSGLWEGSPSSYSYEWRLDEAQVGDAAVYRVGEEDHGTLTCIVSAHYGGVAVPAEASVVVPARPQPTLCPQRAVALVSARPAGEALLLFGAAVQSRIRRVVRVLRRSAGHRGWRHVASGRVNGSGYFEVRVPGSRRGSAGAYQVAIGRTLSNPVDVPGVLQITSDRSRPGESVVALRLSRAATRSGSLTVKALRECASGATIAAATLAPGAGLAVRLTVAPDAGPGYYRAILTIGRRTYSTELIVPRAGGRWSMGDPVPPGALLAPVRKR